MAETSWERIARLHRVTIGIMLLGIALLPIVFFFVHPMATLFVWISVGLINAAIGIMVYCPKCKSSVLHRYYPGFSCLRFVPPEKCPVCKEPLKVDPAVLVERGDSFKSG